MGRSVPAARGLGVSLENGPTVAAATRGPRRWSTPHTTWCFAAMRPTPWSPTSSTRPCASSRRIRRWPRSRPAPQLRNQHRHGKMAFPPPVQGRHPPGPAQNLRHAHHLRHADAQGPCHGSGQLRPRPDPHRGQRDLGLQLHAAGYKIIGAQTPVIRSIAPPDKALERYWRWHTGKDEA